MIIGVVVAIVGTSLLSRIGLQTSTVQWATYSVITGIGLGIGIQLPYTAAQAVLRYVNNLETLQTQKQKTDRQVSVTSLVATVIDSTGSQNNIN